MLKCIIIDDEPKSAQALRNFIRKISLFEYGGSFAGTVEALHFLQTKSVDLIFLNIQKPLPSGHMDIAAFKHHGLVIFTSSNKKHAMDAFEHDVLDFLIKPLTLERISKTAEKAYRHKMLPSKIKPEAAMNEKGGFIFIKEATRLVRVELDDIYYIMGLKNYVSIFTRTQRIVSLQTMKQIEELLPENRFIRVHRSYLVAWDKIVSIEKQQISIKDKEIPIGQLYFPHFMKKLTSMSNP